MRVATAVHGALLLLAALAGPAAAQSFSFTPRGEGGWLGVGYEVRWQLLGARCAPEVLVEHVVHGSPAERAGLRAGDAIIAVDGAPAPAPRLSQLAARLAPGDSVRLRFRRDGREREVTAVADRRPARPPAGLTRAGGLTATTAPVVRFLGDTVVVENLERTPGRVSGYWVAADGGRVEYRRLRGWSGDATDARVRALLECAERTEWEPAVARVDLRQVRERADSLRMVIARRALAREGQVEWEVREPHGELRVAPAPGGESWSWIYERSAAPGRAERVEAWVAAGQAAASGAAASAAAAAPSSGYILRIEDYVSAGLRGVAGAEVTTLEPELAEYFRNVQRGLLVLRAAPGTPASRAGLRPGDVIVAGNGRPLVEVAELRSLVAAPGEVELRVVRRGDVRTVTIRRP